MERIWQWAWDRHGPRYFWTLYTVGLLMTLPIYLVWSQIIVAIEGSGRYAEAAVVVVIVVPVLQYVVVLPGIGRSRVLEHQARGHEVDRAQALDATYAWARSAIFRTVATHGAGTALVSVVVGVIAGAAAMQVVQYGILGALAGSAMGLTGVHSLTEGAMRPIRVALAGDTSIGDALPRPRPGLATWSSVSVLGVGFVFAVVGGMLASTSDRAHQNPVLFAAVGGALTLGFGVPITAGLAFAPSLRPIRDLSEGTRRVAAGDYSQRVPVVQDDDLGALAASFNRMQAGLAERQRLQSAFGTYVDAGLAARLLDQGDDVFTGERREVTVMFVDIRDFTPFAEANTAEDTVIRLNALFEIV
ncbi:HAMP domain-containing protein, partial [Mycobacterium cookii]